jgi:hypothetical protein
MKEETKKRIEELMQVIEKEVRSGHPEAVLGRIRNALFEMHNRGTAEEFERNVIENQNALKTHTS